MNGVNQQYVCMNSMNEGCQSGADLSEAPPVRERPTIGELFKVFLTAGAISFGGGVVAYLRQYLVKVHGWLDDDDFLDALEVSETLPGLNSVNMSVIVGDRMRGAFGAAVAVIGLMLPGMVVMMTLGVPATSRRQPQPLSGRRRGIGGGLAADGDASTGAQAIRAATRSRADGGDVRGGQRVQSCARLGVAGGRPGSHLALPAARCG
jgi:hypothetical protein